MQKNWELLSEEIADKDPFVQFEKWYNERLSGGLRVPNNLSLATSSKGGQPSVRTVLLKEFDANGFVFFSNYRSRKGIELEINPLAAILFYWPESSRQVRIEGPVSRISPDESDNYFQTRPEENRLSAWASEQSSVIRDRQYLVDRVRYYKKFFDKKPIERPPHWGGYRLKPVLFEFWQEREYRLHDRITYSLASDKWIIKRLAP